MEILKQFAQEAKKLNGTIIFAEGDEDRTLEAAVKLVNDGICKVIVVAPKAEMIQATAQKKNLDISRLAVMVPAVDKLDKTVLEAYLKLMEVKGTSREDALKLAADPLTFSALYVKSGKASGCVAGARSSTPDVIRAALRGIGAAPGTKFISSFFLMIPPEKSCQDCVTRPVIYADCGVNPDPSANGLRDIAIASIHSFRSLFPKENPRIAFLSFSTKGSAEHRMLQKIIDATKMTQEYFKDDPSVIIDGELQFDAAAVPAVAKRKAPNSPVAGQANIFIFPDLNAGNICYKVTERLGCFTAIGPLLQGLALPMNDLSRGCSVDDIYYAAVIALLKSRTLK